MESRKVSHHHLLDSTRAGYTAYIKCLELCATAMRISILSTEGVVRGDKFSYPVF
ncbi:MAG: hypothetical protein SNH27_13240 [Rikenellaceae bacterium]